MKYFKLAILAFVACFCIYAVGAKATTYRTFLSISIPKSSNYYESVELSKNIDNYQYYNNQSTNGNFGGTSNVYVKTNSQTMGISISLKVNNGLEKTWGEDVNMLAANYRIRISSTSILTGATHTGHWLLDGRLAGTL